MLKARAITKSYGNLQVLQGIDIEVAQGEIIAIVGASGAGKSTLLHILATLDKPDRGTLQLGNDDLLKLRGKQLAAFRNKYVGFVFQFHNLLPEFTTLENICIPGYLGKLEKETVEKKAKELLALLHIEHRANHKPSELSGGEQQRVAVARALINNPKIIFADEPSGSLDSKNAEALHQLFFDLRKTLGQTLVFATHNQTFAAMADRKLCIQDGRFID
ncbi:MAG: ABC transporter ATP-binding protein [Cytophagales bacterium]|nr:ABC transporter ATP-binding protein [Cytophagales bacterium]